MTIACAQSLQEPFLYGSCRDCAQGTMTAACCIFILACNTKPVRILKGNPICIFTILYWLQSSAVSQFKKVISFRWRIPIA